MHRPIGLYGHVTHAKSTYNLLTSTLSDPKDVAKDIEKLLKYLENSTDYNNCYCEKYQIGIVHLNDINGKIAFIIFTNLAM